MTELAGDQFVYIRTLPSKSEWTAVHRLAGNRLLISVSFAPRVWVLFGLKKHQENNV